MFIAKPFKLSKGSHAGKIIAEVSFNDSEKEKDNFLKVIEKIKIGSVITFDNDKTYIIRGIERRGYEELDRIPIGLLLEEYINKEE